MGLDMYLYAEIPAPKDSALAAVVEQYATDSHRAQLAHPEEGYAYVSGWSYGEQKPDELYTALAVATGITPHNGSPHIDVYKDKVGGYLVSPTLYYWRKANHIHNWFVEKAQGGVDECQRTEIHPELLLELVDYCEQVTADHDKATALLPTRGGFFFGGTEYDEYYYQDTKETAEGLRQVLTLPHRERAAWHHIHLPLFVVRKENTNG